MTLWNIPVGKSCEGKSPWFSSSAPARHCIPTWDPETPRKPRRGNPTSVTTVYYLCIQLLTPYYLDALQHAASSGGKPDHIVVVGCPHFPPGTSWLLLILRGGYSPALLIGL